MTTTGIFSVARKATRVRSSVALIAVCAVLSSCANEIPFNEFDTSAGIGKKEYEDLLGRRGASPVNGSSGSEPPIPDFQSVIAAPSAPELADTRRVSIAVTETTPVRDILIELARRGSVDLEMDPRITGGIIMTATDRPFAEVIQRIAELAELRYRFERNVLRVELDDPYIEQYRMDVLNMTRDSSSSAASSTDASSVAQAIGAGGGGGGGGNNSSSTVSSSTNSDFWNAIGANIDQVLTGVQLRRFIRAEGVEAAFVPEAQAPAAPAPAAAAPAAGGPLAAAAGLAAANQAAAATAPAAAPELRGGTQPAAAGVEMRESRYSLNPQAGIITVYATQRQQREVERYLRDVRASVTQQVLIEAKVLEITLSDQYRAGINWNAVFGPSNESGNDNLNIITNFTRSVVPPSFTGPTVAANWAANDGDLSLAVQLVKEFGTVRTLSSPRLTVLNNQVALLKVAQNQVFFQLDVQTTEGTASNAPRITVSSEIKTIPVGLIMNVQPAVDPVSNRISLSLRPSITRITGFVNDPGVAVITALAQRENPNLPLVSSPVPIIEVREMDSIVAMESGQTVVLGGLMQETASTTREGLPGLMDIPLVGQAISENIRENKVTELVIFIKATLANAAGTIADEDIRLYKKFGPDPRPIVF